jgi:predicted O-methyltransferase YrrM
MTEDDARQFVEELYAHLLRRPPGPRERENWTAQAIKSDRPQDLFRRFVASREYLARHQVVSVFPAGHFHSPVVDPATIGAYYVRSRASGPADLHGIDIDTDRMLAFWADNLDVMRATSFQAKKNDRHRFFYEGAPYPPGDAIVLRAMIAHWRPARVVEIGSGFSTACMLDSADECGLPDMRITCVEPYPNRLHSLLRPADYERVEVLPTGVQSVPIELFDTLHAGDILFIDSTHVLKTGSDVHYELFGILPRLRPGVVVHVHDCPYPFEYPELWVVERNYSWNEAYALRAFLMYNRKFSVLFWNTYLARVCRARLMADYPAFLSSPGSSIWLLVD